MIFTRYLVKEFLTKVSLTFSVLYLVFFLAQSQRVSEEMRSLGLMSYDFFYLIFYSSFFEILPIWTASVFLGTLSTVISLNTSGELTVAFVGGKNLWQIAKPFFLVACFLALIHLAFANYVRPLMKQKYHEYIYGKAFAFIDSSLENKVRSNSFTHIFQGYSFYAQKVMAKEKKYENVVLAQQNERGGTSFVAAKKAEIRGSIENKDMILYFSEGKAYQLGQEKENFTFSFETFKFPLFRVIISHLPRSFLLEDHEAMNTIELYGSLKAQKAYMGKERYQELMYLFYDRIYSFLLIFTFVALGLILGVYNFRNTSGHAYGICFFIFIISDILFKSGSIWAKSGSIAPHQLVFSLYIVAFLLSFLLLYRKSRRPLWESVL